MSAEMFVIASSGRTGTMALCHGLDRFSDHSVEHEPDPPLEEAWRRHHGERSESAALVEWKRRLRSADGSPYGLSWRAPNLLGEVREAAPLASVLVIVREPVDYVLSAHAKRVLSKATAWDRLRLMPRDGAADALPLAQRIAWHWRTVNEYLLDFAARNVRSRVVLFGQPLEDVVADSAASLGVNIRDLEGLRSFLRARPNAEPRAAPPEGFSRAAIEEICGPLWARATTLSD